MNGKIIKAFRSLLTVVLLGIPVILAQADDISQQQARRLLEQDRILSLETIINKAVQLKPGIILETELESEDDGSYTYGLDILDEDGVAWELEFNAETGELLELERD